jgi:hypothetical protein
MIQMKWGEMGNGEEKESRTCDTEIVRSESWAEKGEEKERKNCIMILRKL